MITLIFLQPLYETTEDIRSPGTKTVVPLTIEYAASMPMQKKEVMQQEECSIRSRSTRAIKTHARYLD